ncbi:deltex E3 ubiquitin ligase [Aureococcus anophagefferens]|uniref:RING-type E3 ubiquitin transferase n=2 Tax=Aureococcus anophagefferens TaxID=44056 RepID=A0ABR1FRU1_AURAN
MAALWQWRDDYGWKDYAPSDSAKIEAAHQARDARPVTLGNARYVVLVTNLEQVNQRTGFATRAPAPARRRASGRVGGARGLFRRRVGVPREGGRCWVPFSPADSAALEAASGRGDAGAPFAFSWHALTTPTSRRCRRRTRGRASGARAPRRRRGGAGATAAARGAGARGPAAAARARRDGRELQRRAACPICGDDFADDASLRAVQLLGCTAVHPQHEACALRWLAGGAGRCGVCGVSVGVRTGGQPDNGVMRDWVEDRALPGFRFGSRTRVVEYDFDDGVQGDRHPNPGRPFSGTYRRCYLPTPEGDAVFARLAVAFERRLVFNVGTSLTTGRSDCVVWAGIHHKTQRTGGAAEHGYPDATYLDRVSDELAAAGVAADDAPLPVATVLGVE